MGIPRKFGHGSLNERLRIFFFYFLCGPLRGEERESKILTAKIR